MSWAQYKAVELPPSPSHPPPSHLTLVSAGNIINFSLGLIAMYVTFIVKQCCHLLQEGYK